MGEDWDTSANSECDAEFLLAEAAQALVDLSDPGLRAVRALRER